MNKEYLKNKIWYRALMVLFFGSLVFVQVLSFHATFNATNSTREFVVCTNGKEFENPYPGFEFYKFSNIADLTKRCENPNMVFTPLTQEQFQELRDKGLSVDQIIKFGKIPDELPYSKYEKAQYTSIERWAFLLSSIIITNFVFWFVARIFFYIILGEKLLSLKYMKKIIRLGFMKSTVVIWSIILVLVVISQLTEKVQFWVPFALWLILAIVKAKEKIENYVDTKKISARDEKIQLDQKAEEMAGKGLAQSGFRAREENIIREDFKFEKRKARRKLYVDLIDILILK